MPSSEFFLSMSEIRARQQRAQAAAQELVNTMKEISMGWKATATVTAVDGRHVTLTATDTAVTATDDDTGITEVSVTVSYPEGTVPHLTPGAVVTINADC